MTPADRSEPDSGLQGRPVVETAVQERADRAAEEQHARNRELADVWEQLSTLREALGRADEMAVAEQTVASVAHQIGTPLNLIWGYVQVIREEEGADSAIGRRLLIVEDQIAKVASALRTIRDRTHRASAREVTSPVRLVEQACAVVRPRLERENVVLVLRAPGAIPNIDADPIQLQLALLNLMTNRLDAMPSGGTVTVTISSANSRVRIEVGDTGPGIAPEQLPHVFDPWTTTKSAGLDPGLGLSIAKNVVEAHGGSIDVRSDLGQGTIFTIDLPVASGALQSSVTPPDTDAQDSHRRRRSRDVPFHDGAPRQGGPQD